MAKPKNEYANIGDFQELAEFVGERFERVDRRFEQMDRKLDDKFGTVIGKLDGIMKGMEDLRQENIVGAEQLRRHEDQLRDYGARIVKVENASA